MKRRMPRFAIIGAAIAGALMSVSLAQGTMTPVKFKAALNVGQEVPHPKGTKVGASGRFTATLTEKTLKWKLTFTHLTGRAAMAHIHMGVKGKAGNVLITLCAPCTSPVSGTSTLTATQIRNMEARKLYVNVHTAKNPNGEIRGQITRAISPA